MFRDTKVARIALTFDLAILTVLRRGAGNTLLRALQPVKGIVRVGPIGTQDEVGGAGRTVGVDWADTWLCCVGRAVGSSRTHFAGHLPHVVLIGPTLAATGRLGTGGTEESSGTLEA